MYLSLVKCKYDYFARTIISDTVFRYIDTSFSEKILAKHNAAYGMHFTVNDMYEAIDDPYPSFNVYDDGMFLIDHKGPGLSKEMKTVFDAVTRKDSASVIHYACSFSPELNTYGGVGLYIWSQEVSPLTGTAKSVFDVLRSSHRKIVFHWGGCIVETWDQSNILTDRFLDELHSAFLAYRSKTVSRSR